MLSIAHTTTGAFIAAKIPNPLLSIPLILTSHYALDAVAHWDAGTGLSTGKKTPRQAILAEIPDLLISLLIIIWFFQLGKPFTPSLSGLAPYWGSFIALIPDFLEAPRNFLQKEPIFLKPLNNFHSRFHHSIPHILDGLAPQLLLLIFLYLLK